jgi:hypothetical protein
MKIHYRIIFSVRTTMRIPRLLLGCCLLIVCSACQHPDAKSKVTPLPSHRIGGEAPSFDSRPGVQTQGPHEYMFVKASGSKVGFSALELEQIARRYNQVQKAPFQLDGTEKMIWIRTDGSPILADVYFFGNIGKPSLHIEIDHDGTVSRYKIVTLVCGTMVR